MKTFICTSLVRKLRLSLSVTCQCGSTNSRDAFCSRVISIPSYTVLDFRNNFPAGPESHRTIRRARRSSVGGRLSDRLPPRSVACVDVARRRGIHPRPWKPGKYGVQNNIARFLLVVIFCGLGNRARATDAGLLGSNPARVTPKKTVLAACTGSSWVMGGCKGKLHFQYSC